MLSRPARRVLLALALAPLAACAGGGDAESDTDSAAAAGADPAATPAAAAPAAADAALGESDIDTYERALAAEVAVLRDAQERMAAATTSTDSMSALFAAADTETEPAAAKSAGIAVERYRQLDQAFGNAIAARQMNPGMQAMMASVDTSYLAELPADQAAAQREQLRKNLEESRAAFSDSATYRTVPAELRETFKARATATLDSLWKERFALRARIAGLGG